MSSRCALRITEHEEAGPPAFTALLGLSRGCGGLGRASLRSLACMGRVWRAASPTLRAYMPRAQINAPSPCCVKRVHERHESPFFGQFLTLVYTFWVPLGHFRTAARPMRPNAPRSLLHRARAPCAPKEWLARAHHIDDVLTTLPLALHCLRNAHAFRSRALRWHNALSPYCDDVPAARGSRRGDIGGGLEAAPFRLAQCGG